MNLTRIALASLACIGFSAPAAALDFTMDFDTIPPAVAPPPPPDQTFGSAVLGFYNNDPVYNRAGKQAWNTTFTTDALAIGSQEDPNGQGNFPTAQSGLFAVGSVSSNKFSFEVSPGLYIAGMSFWYNADGEGSKPAVELFSGGASVYSKALDECQATGGAFCGWKQFVIPQNELTGALVTRVQFSSELNKAVFDTVFLSTAAVPEPSTYALMMLGLAGVAGIARRRVT